LNSSNLSKEFLRSFFAPATPLPALHKDVKINTFSQKFQSNYEHGKKVIYEALDDIDYINEFDLDMPIFEIVSKENGLIKSIKIDNLAKDIQDLILSVILQVIVRTLEKLILSFSSF
jgi:hypothetical protein